MSGVVSRAVEDADEDLGELLEAEADEELAAVVTMLRSESSMSWLCDRPNESRMIDRLIDRLERKEHRR
jgi:hypothetical protein